MNREDLKIEFRAIPYGVSDHALQYRIDPNDENNQYTIIKKYLFGLFKRTITKKYSYDWKLVHYFVGWSDWAEYNCHVNWQPIWIKNEEDLNEYKKKFKTIGQFEKYIKDKADKNYQKWSKDREYYLNKMKVIY